MKKAFWLYLGLALTISMCATAAALAQSMFEETDTVGTDTTTVSPEQWDNAGGGNPSTTGDWAGDDGRIWLSKGDPPEPHPPANPPNAEPFIHTPAVMPYLIRW